MSHKLTNTDLYAVLNIDASASQADIRSAYRQEALKSHPDKGGSSESFHLVALAFETLSDEKCRASYDRKRKHALGPKRKKARDEPQKTDVETQAAPAQASAGQKKSSPEGTEAEGADASRRVAAALQRLQSALQSLHPNRRAHHIQQLRPEIKSRLPSHMEAQRCTKSSSADFSKNPASSDKLGAAQAVNVKNDPSQNDSESCENASSSSDEDGLNLNVAIEDLKHEPESARKASSRHVRGINRTRGKNGTSNYQARLMVAQLVCFTRFQPSLSAAIEHHIILVRIQQKLNTLEQKTPEAINGAFNSVLNECGVSSTSIGLRIVTKICIGSKPCGALAHVFTPLVPLEEALMWRQRLLDAKYEAWSSFRAVWFELLQHPARRGRRYSPQEAEDMLDCWAQRLEPLWGNDFRKRHEGIGSHSERRSDEFIKRRVSKVARAMELDAVDRCRLAQKMKQQRQRRLQEFKRAKRSWLYRKAGKYMTMDDLKEELPTNLRDSAQ